MQSRVQSRYAFASAHRFDSGRQRSRSSGAASRLSTSAAPPPYGIELADRLSRADQQLAQTVDGPKPKAQETPRAVRLPVGQAGDSLEMEANRVAEQVLRTDSITVGSRAVPVQGVSQGASEEGQSAGQAALAFFGHRFGHDFSKVRIRSDPSAAHRADELGARAYTVGNEIGFATGAYAPGTPAGRALLAHELTHVVQKSEGRDARDTPRCAPMISAASFSATTPSPSIAITPFIPGKWFIDLKTDSPGFTLNSAVHVSCGGGTAAGYEVGIVQVETSESSEANYFGLTPADGSLTASKSMVRKPAGPCIDSRSGAFWTADASGEKSLKPPSCGKNVALPTFSDMPSESYPGWKENRLTKKPNYIRDIKMSMSFVDALAVKTPAGNINVLKWLTWNEEWSAQFTSDAAGSVAKGISIMSGSYILGNDALRPASIPAKYTIPATTCVDISAAATSGDYVIEERSSYP